VSGEILLLKRHQHDGHQLNAFAAEVTRVAREVGPKASWVGRRRFGRGRHLEGFDGLGQLDGAAT